MRRAAAVLALCAALAACDDAVAPGTPVASVAVAPQAVLVHPGATATLTARAIDEDGGEIAGSPITWESRDPTIANVDAGGRVDAVGLGRTTVRATIAGRSDSAAVLVFPVVEALAVTPARVALRVGETARLAALLRAASGDTTTWETVSWTSADTAIATVDGGGLVRAVRLGTTTVTGWIDGSAGVSAIAVVPPVDSIVMAPAAPTLVLDAQLRLVATFLDADGDTLPERSAVWTSSDTLVAAVSGVGIVHARGLGTATITASAEGRAGQTTVTVRHVRFTRVVPGELGHTCAIATDSLGLCWGLNSSGTVGSGDPSTEDMFWPRLVAGDLRFVAVSGGEAFSCAITTSGIAYCWGYGPRYRLGNGSQVNQRVPVPVGGTATFGAVIASGHSHTCALTPAGAAYCWGDNIAGDLGTGAGGPGTIPQAVTGGLTFRDIRAGEYFTCGLTADSLAYCWGDGRALGQGDTTDRNVPVPVAGGLTFAALSAGGYHACGVTAAGAAYCWGVNSAGALGDSSTTDRLTPVPVVGGHAWRIVEAAGNHGSDYTCGLTTDGTPLCWGLGAYGVSTGAVVPTPVPGAPAFATLATGGHHACGITPDGIAYCWGANFRGALGDGTTTMSAVPVRVTGQP